MGRKPRPSSRPTQHPVPKEGGSERLRRLLGTFVGAGGTGLIVALVLGAFSASGVVNMATVHVLLILAWVVMTAIIFASEWIWRRPIRYRLAFGLAGSLFIAIGMYGMDVWLQNRSYELTHLTPGSLPTPSDPCRFPPSDFKVFLGNGAVFDVPLFPFTAISFGLYPNGAPYAALQVTRQRGGIDISALRIFGADGKIITRIDKNEIWINSSLRSERPDPHEIKVFDDQDNQVLHLEFLNSKTIYVTGLFRRPDIGYISVHRDHISTSQGGEMMDPLCMSRVDIAIVYGRLPLEALDY
jgi:hypothetical protein